MKKLFTMMAVCLCGTMAYAQTSAISAKDVTIAKGGSSQMEVVINEATSNTAFQFDLKLPAKVSVKSVDMKGSYGDSRKLKYQQVDASNNIYRFLSYDNENAKLTSAGDGVIITLEAETEAESGKASLNGEDQNLVVNPAGESTAQAAGDLAGITVADGVQITIGASGKTTFVCGKDLDFSSQSDVKAFIATGYDLASGDVWLTRVKDVPANTPIWVKGPESKTLQIPEGKSAIYYPKNLLVGSATEAVDIPAENDDYAGYTLLSDGKIFKQADGVKGFPAGKAYLYLPKTIKSSVGDALALELGSYGNTTLVSSVDLDFTDVEGLRAYAVTGFDKDGTIWLSRVKTASAGTPLYLKGAAGKYTIPSAEEKICYVNMLAGDATNSTALTPVAGDFTTLVLIEGKFGKLSVDATFPGGKAYLPVPTAYLPAASRGNGAVSLSENEAEVIKVSLESLEGNGETTGISRIAAEAAGKDVWFNLSGQRINTPTKKGLYIKNGKKVIVK